MDKTNTAYGLEKVAKRGKGCNLQKIRIFFLFWFVWYCFFIFIRKSQSGGPGFQARSGHLLDLFAVTPS